MTTEQEPYEGEQEVLDDEETYEGEDSEEQPEEELEDAPEGEGPEGESPDDDGEDAEEESTYEIEFESEDGDTVTESYTKDELREIVKNYKYGSPEESQLARQVGPYMDRFGKSAALQYVDYLLSQGLDDRAVLTKMYEDLEIKGYGKLARKAKVEEETPEFDTVEDGIKFYTEKIRKEIMENEVGPLREELKAIKEKERTGAVINNNKRVLDNALKKHGWDPERLDNKQIEKVVKKYGELHSQPFNSNPMNQPQANILIKEALDYRKGNFKKGKPSPELSKMAQQARVPKILPAKKSAKQTTTGPPKLPDIVTAQQAKANLNKLFS